jgi:type IV secretory pathway TraG/TraD family ATPase VirD4
MPASAGLLEPQTDPSLSAEGVARWLALGAGRVLLGLTVGIIAARLMRRRQLHWSWSAVVLAVVLLARPVLEGWTVTLTIGALSAAGWGRSWHRADLDAGRDLAETAAGRQNPIEVVRRLGRDAAMRRREGLGAHAWSRRDELVVGRDERGRLIAIPFGDGAGGTHTLLVGATGSGKTVSQTWMAARAIERGMGAVVVDPKGDRNMRGELRHAAVRAARPFIEWTPGGPTVYNPYGGGSDTEIADKALAGERFTEPHYLRQAQRYLGHVVRLLRKAGLEVSLKSIVELLDPAALEQLARTLPEPHARATHAYLDAMTARQRSDLSGVRDRLAILAESDVGAWLDPDTPRALRFDLLQAVRARAVVYFDLDADSRPLLAQMLGAAVVQDLQTTVAAMQTRPTSTVAVIDEFSALEVDQVVRLFGRARSAGVSLVLSTQELADLHLPGHDRLLERVMGNLSVLIAHRQVVPESARVVASLSGTKGVWRTSRNSDGRTTRTRSSQDVLSPEQVMRLGPGCAAVIVLTRGSARLARIFSPERR